MILEKPTKAEFSRAANVAKQTSELFSRGVAHHQAGRLAEAERLYREILDLCPTHAESHSNLALAAMGRGHYAEAIAFCVRAISLRPDYLEAYINLVGSLEASHQFEEAALVYDELIPLAPCRDDLLNNLGVNLQRLGKIPEALEAYMKAVEIGPSNADAYFNMARALVDLRRADEAIAAYRRVIILQPDHAAACSNLGTLLCSAGEFSEASTVGRYAAAHAPNDAAVWCNLGVILQRQGNVEEAIVAYERAIALNPRYAGAYANLGVAYQEKFQFDDAILAFQRAATLQPDFDTAIAELIKLRRHICEWSEYEDDARRLISLVDDNKDVAISLLLMAFPSTPSQQLKCGRNLNKRLNAVAKRFSGYRIDLGSPVIRIGYISNDFRDHPVGRLVVELFSLHDRSKCEVFAYSMGKDDDSSVRRRIREGSDHFIDIHPLSNVEAANRIHQDAIEILIDLTGPALGSRMEILADRPAPVQVSYIGWPGTMGADWIDYIIADPYLVPFSQEPWFSEKIVHLPDCYQPSDPKRIRAPLRVTRADCGLAEDAFVYCSFNNTVKLMPDMFDTWMRILTQVEHSVLWLYCKSPATKENLLRRAELRGISDDEIVFASFAAMDVYLSRLSLADLFLDSFPYNAGATCNDALWAGLPVLTCGGETYVSRMAGSLLTALRLPELITHSLEEYEAMAVKLAAQPAELKSIRQRLTANRDLSPLFDMNVFTKNLENVYVQMQKSWRCDEKPAAFAIQR